MAMKFRLIRNLLLLYTLCALLASVAVALGRQLSPSSNYTLLAHGDCQLPCLLNVTPGETQRTTAMNALTALAEFPIDQSGAVWSFQLPDQEGNLINGTLISGEDGIIHYMRLYTRRWAGLGIRLGDLMQNERMHPSTVYRSCSDVYPVRLLLTYEGSPRISVAAVIADSVTPHSPVSMIDVSTNDEFFTQTLATVFSGGCYLPSSSAWRGFGRTWIYGPPPFFTP
jgi:hypothetical protein